MAPYVSDLAKKNLQRGIRKMEKTMSRAAQVRRNFQLGRPKKSPDVDEPLHPAIVWQRANAALTDFQGRMSAAKLSPEDATAFIVYVGPPNFDEPQFLAIEGIRGADKTPEDHRRTMHERLGAPDTLALGLVFIQTDREAGERGQRAYFPYQFIGLSLRAQAVLRKAATQLMEATALTDKPLD